MDTVMKTKDLDDGWFPTAMLGLMATGVIALAFLVGLLIARA